MKNVSGAKFLLRRSKPESVSRGSSQSDQRRRAARRDLRALPVVDAQEGVVGKGETDPGGSELAG